MPDLLVIVPSRGRPQNIARLREAMQRTCVADTDLLVGCDQDDPTLAAYLEQVVPVVKDGLRHVVAWLNYLALPMVKRYPLIGHFGDDNVPQTVGWDRAVIEALERQPFCFGDDLNTDRAPGSLCCHIFMRSSVIKRLGYMSPPGLKHMYADPVWWEWGQAVGIEYLSDVVIEHLHPSLGKSEMDQSYRESSAHYERDRLAFEAYCSDGLAADIAKLRA